MAAVIAAAHEGFVAVLTALRAQEDPDSAWFGEFVMAAASAADGRDALLFAPSMPTTLSPGTTVTDEEAAAGIAGDIAALCGLAAVRLARAAGQAADPGDQAACERAARCAQRICELLAGAGA